MLKTADNLTAPKRIASANPKVELIKMMRMANGYLKTLSNIDSITLLNSPFASF
jgi:hypothetical protein